MKIMDYIDKLFIGISSISLFAIMIIVAIDGLLRQFFDSPIKGAYELVESYLMVAMVFLALGYTWAKGGHISITFLHNKLPIVLRNLTYLMILLIGIFIMSLIGYTGLERTTEAFQNNSLTSGLIRWPIWIAYVWVPLGSALFILRLVLEFIFSIIRIFKNGINNVVISEVKDKV